MLVRRLVSVRQLPTHASPSRLSPPTVTRHSPTVSLSSLSHTNSRTNHHHYQHHASVDHLVSKAKAQVFYGPNEPFQLIEFPLPSSTDLPTGDVIVKISLATICGSDLHTVGGTRAQDTPCILGHEAVGVVSLSARPEIKKGQRVTWTIADSCGHCDPCSKHAMSEKCIKVFKYGHASTQHLPLLSGCYATHIHLRSGTHIVPIPHNVPDEAVAPANCALATVVNAVEKLDHERHLHSAVVQGAGLLGLYTVALLKARGVTHVFCTDIVSRKLEKVEAFGGIPINMSERHEAEHWLTRWKGKIDAVVETAGVVDVFDDGIKLLRHGGHYVLVGMVHPDSKLNITGETLIRKCLHLTGVHNYSPRHLEKAVTFLSKVFIANTNPVLAKAFRDVVATPIFSLNNFNEAMRSAALRNSLRIGVSPFNNS